MSIAIHPAQQLLLRDQHRSLTFATRLQYPFYFPCDLFRFEWLSYISGRATVPSLILLLFLTLVAIGPLVRHARSGDDAAARRRFGLADLPT